MHRHADAPRIGAVFQQVTNPLVDVDHVLAGIRIPPPDMTRMTAARMLVEDRCDTYWTTGTAVGGGHFDNRTAQSMSPVNKSP